MSWYRESKRHSLAARGIKTNEDIKTYNNLVRNFTDNSQESSVVNDVIEITKSKYEKGRMVEVGDFREYFQQDWGIDPKDVTTSLVVMEANGTIKGFSGKIKSGSYDYGNQRYYRFVIL